MKELDRLRLAGLRAADANLQLARAVLVQSLERMPKALASAGLLTYP